MNEKPSNSLRKNCSENTTLAEEETLADKSSSDLDDDQSATENTYELFFWYFAYVKMFITRLIKDLFKSAMRYFYSDQVLPEHMVHLMRMQLDLYKERVSRTASYSSSREHHRHRPTPSLSCSVRKFITAIKSYILSSEDDMGIHYSISKHRTESSGIDKEPMFVIVDSSGLSNPSSKELLIDDTIYDKDTVLRKYFNKYVKTAVNKPTTSTDLTIPPQIQIESESREEVQVIDINLQSENDIALVDNDSDHDESIVLAYIRNRDAGLELEGTLLASKKKVSLLESVPKMETIVEGQRFSSLPSTSKNLLPQSFLIEEILEDESDTINE